MPSKATPEKPRGFKLAASGAALSIKAAEGDGESKKLGTFEGIAYTGAPMKPGGWGYPVICDLDGFEMASGQRPALRQHDPNQIVGHTESVKSDSGGVKVAGVFSGEEQHVNKVTVPARNGFRWEMSIGADPIESSWLDFGEEKVINGRTVTGPMTIYHRTKLGEVSFVPLGADDATSVDVAASKPKGFSMNPKELLRAAKSFGNLKAAKYSDEDIDKMSEDDAKAAFKKCQADDDGDDKEKEAKAKAADDAKAKAADDDEKKKDEDKKADASAATRIQARRKAEADEDRRTDSIRATVRKYGITAAEHNGKKVENFGTYAIEEGLDARDVELVCLRAARPGAGVGGPHIHVPGEPILSEAVLEAAVFDSLPSFKLFDKDFYAHGDNGQRRTTEREERRITAELGSRYTDQVRQAAHTRFKGRMGLQQFLTTMAAANGYRGPATFNDPSGWGEVANHLAATAIRADGPSSINAPATLANVQNKFVLQGYFYTEQAFMEFCNVLPVKDLKPTKSVQLFGDFVFRPLNVNGEIQHASVGDNPYANQAALEARMITIPLEYLINDDLGMFGQVPMMLGRGWGLRVNDLVYTKLLSPGYDDGGSTNFFAATHTLGAGQSANSNYISGASSALSSASLQTMKQTFDKQVDPANKPLGVDAEILLYPPELDVPAIELMNAQFIVMAGLASTSAASKQPNTNIWKGRFKPVMSRYLSNAAYTGYSTTAHYLFANPAILPVIQIAALNGQMTPTVQQAGQDWQFNMLGISMRGWGGVGVGMQNFRGAVKSAGV